MKRELKNIIIILIIIIAGVCSYFTMKNTQTTNNNSAANQQDNQMPPQMPSQGSNSEDSNSQNNEKQMGEPPAKPDGENNGNSSNQEPKEMPNMNQQKSKSEIQTIHYVIFGIEGFIISTLVIYLAMSKFNKYTLRETFNEANIIIIFVLLTLILTTILTISQVYITNKVFSSKNTSGPNGQQMMPEGNMSSASTSVTKSGETEVNGTDETLTASYTTSESDKSVILVENGGNLTLDSAEVSKTGGDSSNTENSEFYGVNAGILVTENSTATIKNATIATNAKGSNAVFSTGTDSKIYISDSTITTTGSSSSRGLDATYGGYIEADNVKITTQGGSCATLATDRGEGTGTFTAKNSSLSVQSGSKYYKTAPMFFITNTDAVINLNNCKLSYGSNILISSKGTSEWGKSGSNGGNVTLNAENQTLEGNIEIDNISTLIMNLSSSSYSGTINADNTAKSIALKLDTNSSITLTGDSYVTSLDDSDSSYSNINFNGYKLYVNGVAIN